VTRTVRFAGDEHAGAAPDGAAADPVAVRRSMAVEHRMRAGRALAAAIGWGGLLAHAVYPIAEAAWHSRPLNLLHDRVAGPARGPHPRYRRHLQFRADV